MTPIRSHPAELESRSNRLARLFQARGIRRGQLVALQLAPEEASATILALRKLEASFVSISPLGSSERVAFILRDGQASAFITTAALAPTYAEFRGVLVLVDHERAMIEHQSPEPFPPVEDNEERPEARPRQYA